MYDRPRQGPVICSSGLKVDLEFMVGKAGGIYRSPGGGNESFIRSSKDPSSSKSATVSVQTCTL